MKTVLKQKYYIHIYYLCKRMYINWAIPKTIWKAINKCYYKKLEKYFLLRQKRAIKIYSKIAKNYLFNRAK